MKMSLYSSFKKFVSTLEMIFYFKKHLSSARAKFSGAPASQEKKKKTVGWPHSLFYLCRANLKREDLTAAEFYMNEL